MKKRIGFIMAMVAISWGVPSKVPAFQQAEFDASVYSWIMGTTEERTSPGSVVKSWEKYISPCRNPWTYRFSGEAKITSCPLPIVKANASIFPGGCDQSAYAAVIFYLVVFSKDSNRFPDPMPVPVNFSGHCSANVSIDPNTGHGNGYSASASCNLLTNWMSSGYPLGGFGFSAGAGLAKNHDSFDFAATQSLMSNLYNRVTVNANVGIYLRGLPCDWGAGPETGSSDAQVSDLEIHIDPDAKYGDKKYVDLFYIVLSPNLCRGNVGVYGLLLD